jgi:hypothetical protein
MLKSVLFFFVCLWLSQAAMSAEVVFDDEDDGTGHHPYKTPPGSEWKELDVALPAYPRKDALVAVSIGSSDYPFTVFVDPDSLSVGKDRVVRYTVVLQSRSGAENVSYEGMMCNRRKVKRYAYGSNNQFQRTPGSDWAFIRRNRQDLHRMVLADRYFCPLPSGDMVDVIRDRLALRGHEQQLLWDRE